MNVISIIATTAGRRTLAATLAWATLSCSGEGIETGSGDAQKQDSMLSGDFVFTGYVNEAGETIWEQHELTVVQRKEMLELNLLEADYMRMTEKYTPEGFILWLQQEGRQDVVDRFQSQLDPSKERIESGSVTGQISHALSGSSDPTTCTFWKKYYSSQYRAQIYTGSNFSGSVACIVGDLGDHHLDLTSFANGIFHQNVDSLITFASSLRTYYGSNEQFHDLDSYVPAASGRPTAYWSYSADPGVCVGSH